MSGFNPKDYEAQIAASRERIAKTCRFEEPDRVPVVMGCAGSYYSWLMGVNIRDYYADIDTQIDVQLFGLEWAFGTLQDDRTSYALNLDPGPIGEALLFDMEIIRPDNTSPWAVRKLTDPDEILTFEVPDPRQARGVQEHLKRIEKFKVGQLVEGVITRLTKFGAFARLEGDIEGLIHISEISERRIEHPREVLKEGEGALPMLGGEAVKIRQIAEDDPPDLLGPVDHLAPRDPPLRDGLGHPGRPVPVDEDVLRCGPKVARPGDEGSGEGVHDARLPDARPSEKPDCQEAPREGLELSEELPALVKEGLPLVLRKGEEGGLSEDALDLSEVLAEFVDRIGHGVHRVGPPS